MKMSKDEKRRIYETEKVRLKARQDFEKEGGGRAWVWVIVIAVLAGGLWLLWHKAKSQPSRLMAQVEQIIESTEETSQQQGVGSVWEQVLPLLETEKDPAALVALVREARAVSDGIATDGYDFRKESYWMSASAAVYRLGEIGTEETAAALVELLCDETLSWDEHKDAVNIAHAISICGKTCLPYLEQVPTDHSRRDFVDDLIPYLQRGDIIDPE